MRLIAPACADVVHVFPNGRSRRRLTRLALLGAALGAVSGCAAAKASVQILSAEQALHRAETYQAPEVAVYEYTMATEYLDKAREEAGYADYRIADALARKSAEWSDRAIIFVERHGRGELNIDELSDTTAPPPKPTSPLGDPEDDDDHDVPDVPEDDDGLDPP